MRIQAQFRVAGNIVSLETETGIVRPSAFALLQLLKARTDKQGVVHSIKLLNGDRVWSGMLEASGPTLTALLAGVEQDEARLRPPPRVPSRFRTVHRSNTRTGEDWYEVQALPI